MPVCLRAWLLLISSAVEGTDFVGLSEEKCAKQYSQCGGTQGLEGWTGPNCCEPGSHCKKLNTHYHQCVPGSASGHKAKPPPKKTAPTLANADQHGLRKVHHSKDKKAVHEASTTSEDDNQLSITSEAEEEEEEKSARAADGSCRPRWMSAGPGAGTRYWDCCKPHCGGEGGDCFHGGFCQGVVDSPVKTCFANGSAAPASYALATSNSACSNQQCDPTKDDQCLFTCTDQVPEAINETHAYVLVVAPLYLGLQPSTWDSCPSSFKAWKQLECAGDPSAGAWNEPDGCLHTNKMEPGGECCGCYEFTMDGGSLDGVNARTGLKGKKLIAQVTNIGYDVTDEGHFDIMIPGGGFGIFSACSAMTGIQNTEVKAHHEVWYPWGGRTGGLLSECDRIVERQISDPFTSYKPPGRGFKCPPSKLSPDGTKWKDKECGNYQKYVKQCLLKRCDYLFGGKAGPKNPSLLAGCQWHAKWFEGADNPTFRWKRTQCPKDITAKSGCTRCGEGDKDHEEDSLCSCGESEACTERNRYCAAAKDSIDPGTIEAGRCSWAQPPCDNEVDKVKPDHCSWGPQACKECGGTWCPGNDGHPHYANNRTCESGLVAGGKGSADSLLITRYEARAEDNMSAGFRFASLLAGVGAGAAVSAVALMLLVRRRRPQTWSTLLAEDSPILRNEAAPLQDL